MPQVEDVYAQRTELFRGKRLIKIRNFAFFGVFSLYGTACFYSPTNKTIMVYYD